MIEPQRSELERARTIDEFIRANFPSAEGSAYLLVAHVGDAAWMRFAEKNILDEADIQEMGDELSRLLETPGTRNAIIDFAEVNHLSSAAIGTLITLFNRAKSLKVHLFLAGIDPQIYEVFAITKLNRLFSIYPSAAAVLVRLAVDRNVAWQSDGEGRPAAEFKILERIVAASGESGDYSAEYMARVAKADLLTSQGDYAAERREIDEAVGLMRKRGSARWLFHTLPRLVELDPEGSVEYLNERWKVAIERLSRREVETAAIDLAGELDRRSLHSEALLRLRESLEASKEPLRNVAATLALALDEDGLTAEALRVFQQYIAARRFAPGDKTVVSTAQWRFSPTPANDN